LSSPPCRPGAHRTFSSTPGYKPFRRGFPKRLSEKASRSSGKPFRFPTRPAPETRTRDRPMVYTSTDQIDFEPADCPALPRPGRVLLASPDHYDVRYVINPHMEGNVGEVDTALAAEQWRALRTAYET